MTRALTIRGVLLFLASAVLYGLIEATHVKFGEPTLFHFFIANYHLPMAGIMVILAIGLDRLQDIPLWVMIEDMSFWIFSGQELAKSSWISIGLSGMTVAGLYLPWTYVLLVGLWGIFVFIRWSYGRVKIKFGV